MLWTVAWQNTYVESNVKRYLDGKNADDIVALQNPINNNSAKIQLSIISVNKFCFNSLK